MLEEYFKLLEPDYPTWIDEYIACPELQKQQYISVTCGAIYSKLYNIHNFYSSLDHSKAVALIVWHFTHDKKQTLAGLLHDIATPTFKHCVDFLNGDYLMQESTEDLTTEIIKNSTQIMSLLKRDNIKLEEVNDYHIYPIADNDTPRLSADRLEYSLSNGYITYETNTFDEIKEMYNDLFVGKNEDGVPEIQFKTKKIARAFVKMTTDLSIIYRDDRTRFSMQFIADLLKKLDFKKEDLYSMKESEVIKKIENSKYKGIWNKWKNASKVKTSDIEPENVYFVHLKAKTRYINPLVKGERISNICKTANKMIEKNLSYSQDKYVYLDFNF